MPRSGQSSGHRTTIGMTYHNTFAISRNKMVKNGLSVMQQFLESVRFGLIRCRWKTMSWKGNLWNQNHLKKKSILWHFFTKLISINHKNFCNNPNLHERWHFYLLVILDQILSADFLSKLSKLFEGANWHQSCYFDTLPSSLSL